MSVVKAPETAELKSRLADSGNSFLKTLMVGSLRWIAPI